jgi:hypothetical protein
MMAILMVLETPFALMNRVTDTHIGVTMGFTIGFNIQTAITRMHHEAVSNYQDMITAQQAQLSSERLATQLLGQRQLASVFLIKALGGDWVASSSNGSTPVATAAK